MFHQRSPDFDIVMTNEAYRERYGKDNPNIALIHALKQAGVDCHESSRGSVLRPTRPSGPRAFPPN